MNKQSAGMAAYVVEWRIACNEGNDYLSPTETTGKMAFGGKDDAQRVAQYIRDLGVPDSHGFSNRCESVKVSLQHDVPHKFVLHSIPKWVTKYRVAI